MAALITVLKRARSDPARAAIAGAFIALLFHTPLYADFLEDPITWTVLAIGVALAGRPEPAPAPHEAVRREPQLQQQPA